MRNNIFISSFFETLRIIYETFINWLWGITLLVAAVSPSVIIMSGLTIKQKIILLLVFLYVVLYLTVLTRKTRRRDAGGFPLPPCHLVDVDEKSGFVDLREGMEEASILYLAEIEEYMRRNHITNERLTEKQIYDKIRKRESKGRRTG